MVSPRRIVKHVRKISPHLSPGRQEDSHDLYLAMLEAMEAMLLHEGETMAMAMSAWPWLCDCVTMAV